MTLFGPFRATIEKKSVNREVRSSVDTSIVLERLERGLGNTDKPTKQGNQSLKWCFTINNYDLNNVEHLEQKFNNICKKFVFQQEIGEECGTPHIQGCCWFSKRKRLSELKKIHPTAHWERCKSWKHSVLYCSKQDTRQPDTKIHFKGVKIKREIKTLKLSQLYPWQKDLLTIIKGIPDDRSIHWIWEDVGNIGKSTFCKYLVIKHKAIILSGKASDMKNGIRGYIEENGDYPELVVLDIPRTSQDYLSYQGIEEIKNACFFSGKYEGGMVVGNNPHLICFANFRPEVSKLSKDRWRIKFIGEGAPSSALSSDT